MSNNLTIEIICCFFGAIITVAGLLLGLFGAIMVIEFIKKFV